MYIYFKGSIHNLLQKMRKERVSQRYEFYQPNGKAKVQSSFIIYYFLNNTCKNKFDKITILGVFKESIFIYHKFWKFFKVI